eukprot:TRINITY_DN1179_c0_g1_i14.p1 TRINITY_DN1179_c0_g1~~TRINITY_DN1179_c0_g1_i14.p1  ORF type:complete len:7328 (+),score=1490.81 TRINITY_DN1179_c0_g1_i14:2229-21986(+)
MLTTTEAGATASYTVKLRSQPTATVTIPVASSDTSEGSVSPSTLVFTTLDWNAAKTVVITGVNDDVDDGDVAFTVITGAATSPDAVYHGMSGVAVGVTNTDDDTVGFTVSATALATSEGGVAAVFTVVLNTQPTATVTLPLASSDATEGTASTLSLTFTSANWNQPQTVTITGVDDNLDDGDQAYNVVFAAALSGDPLYQGQKPADIPAVNSDNDVAGVTVTPTTGLQTSEAGASATFTVQLNTAPTAPVTFPVVSLTPTEGTVDKATLSFDTATWATPQTVTVTGVQDLVQDGPVPYTVALQAATSTDAKYNTFDPADVALINNDDDAAGVTITPTSMLVTTEAGGTAQFTVVLNSMPTQTVTIGLTSSNPAEGTVPPTVTFTTTDWMTAQAITVTGVPDDVDDGDVSFTVITANTASADPNYNAIDVPDVSATNTDDDTAAVIFNPTAGLTTTEAGGTATFAVRLASKPVQPVTLTLASSNTGEGIPTPASLTFTDMTWNADQMVIVTGQNDAVVDGTIAYTISTTVTTTDTAYAAVVVPTVSAANTDDDAAGITVTSAAVLALTEGGGSATYTIQLTSQPTADVTVPVQSSDTTEGTASPLSIAFTTLNWNVPQTVTVVGVNDAVDDGDVAFFLSNGPAASTDPNYQGRQGTNVQASTADDDTASITVTPQAGLTTTEAGGTATFTVQLTSQPVGEVTVPVSTSDASEGSVTPTVLSFRAEGWSVAQTVTVSGLDDSEADGDVAFFVLLAAASSIDTQYHGMDPANVACTNTDDDIVGVTVQPTTGLTTTEAGATATFTVVLKSQPSASVTIPVASSRPTEGTVSPAQLVFSPLAWNTPQTVTVVGVPDAVDDGNQAYTVQLGAATSTDAKYQNIDPDDVAVVNSDLNTAGITVSPTAGLTTSEAGGQARFTVVLNTQPLGAVTIGITTNAQEATLSSPSVTFTTANWNQAQEVVVTGRDDSIDDGDVAYTVVLGLASSPADTTYNGIDAADVQLTNTDDDTAGVSVTPAVGLTTSEAGGTATFNVQLVTEPTATVTVTFSSSTTTEGTVAPATCVFTAATWATPQAVTVTGVDEKIADGNVDYTIVTGIMTSDVLYAAIDPVDVTVQSIDDDSPSLVLASHTNLAVSEAGTTATYTVSLGSQPVQPVTVPITPQSSEVTVSPTSLTFAPNSWNTLQTVTVSAVNDDVDDADLAFTIGSGPTTSTDPMYQGIVGTLASGVAADDDTVGVTILPITGLVTTEAGQSTTFTLVLSSQPTGTVTIPLLSGNTAEVTVNPGSVAFDTGNWNVPQTVTLSGVDDQAADGDQVVAVTTSAAQSSDAKYRGFDAVDLTVTNTDDDVVGIVATTTGTETSEGGASVDIVVRLNTMPTADVTVPLVSTLPAEGTPTPSSLTFAPANWNIPQTVRVNGVDDDVVDGTVAYLINIGAATSTDAKYNSQTATPVALTNTDNDAAGFTITPTKVSTTEAGGVGTFTVVLKSQPSATVTLPLSSSDTAEATPSPGSLSFTAANWNVPQVVTVTGVDDAVADGTRQYVIVTGTATGADVQYAGVNPVDVTGENADNDAAGIVVNPPTAMPGENGDIGVFTVALGSRPTATVVIPLVSANTQEGSMLTTSLTFTPADWNVPQNVRVQGVDDRIVDGNVAFTVKVDPAVSSDGNYNGLDASDVQMTNTDNDAAGIAVAPTASLVTTEFGSTATFVISLNAEPTAGVVIDLASSNVQEGAVSSPSVTFTPLTWNTPQTVTVTGQDDSVADGNVAYFITTSAASSADPAFNGLDVPDVGVTNNDDDTPGFTVSPLTGTTTEQGSTMSFTVVLNTQPASQVSVQVSSSDLMEGVVMPAQVVFLPSNWNAPQTVVVSGVDDTIDDGDVSYNVVTTAAVSSDPQYSSMDPPDVQLQNTDDDTAGITVNAAAGLQVSEAGATATFTVVLNSAPLQSVTIALTSSAPTEGSVSPASVIFSSTNWNTPQTVTVTGVDDKIDDGDQVFSIVTAAAVSTDPLYSGMASSDVTLTNIDDDASGITVSKSAVNTSEPSSTDTITIVLLSEPRSQVVVPFSVDTPTEAGLSATSLTFTPTNWKTPQTLTVTGIDDLVADGTQAYQIIFGSTQSTDATYAGVALANVAGVNRDDDSSGVVLTTQPPLVTSEAGATTGSRISIALSSQPTADVIVSLDLQALDTTEGTAAPTSFTFTGTNWKTPQVLTVTGVDDLIDDGDVQHTIKFVAVVSTDSVYSGMAVNDVVVTNTDDDAAGVVLDPAGPLVTSEGGKTASFTIKLASEPVADVRIGLVSSDLTEGTPTPLFVTFSPLTWNTPQTVSVAGVQDQIDDGDIQYMINTQPAASTDLVYNGYDGKDMQATNEDDDTAGVRVTPTSMLQTDEGGTKATFTVSLDTEPTADVNIPVASSNTGEARVSPAKLTFTSTNWNTPQTVTVAGVNDDVDDGDQAFTVTLGAAVSSDVRYGMTPPPLNGINRDDDTAAVQVVSASTPLRTQESGQPDSFTVQLKTRPTSEVKIALGTSDATEGTVSLTTLTFHTLNWNTPQTVSVAGVDDPEQDGDIAYSVRFTGVTSTDPQYDKFSVPDVPAVNADDDVANITVSPVSGISTTEAGGTASFVVQVASKPAVDVTVPISSSDTSEGVVMPASVQFTPANWMSPQTVTVTGVDDMLADGAQAYTIITGVAVTTDLVYAGMNPPDVEVTNDDDEIAAVTVTPSRLSVREEGQTSEEFTVSVTSQPQADVLIRVTPSDGTQVSLSVDRVLFDATNWQLPQTVKVTAVDDKVAEGDTIVNIALEQVVSTDAVFAAIDPQDVEVTILDNDVPALVVNPTSGLTTTEQGGTATFTVALSTQPRGTTTVAVASQMETEGTVNAVSLSFTATTWNVPQTVTVTGVQDTVADGDMLYNVKVGPTTSTDALYSALPVAFVSVTNTDDDVPGVTVTPLTGLVTTEAGGTATFTVRINTQPSSDVTVSVSSSDLTEGQVDKQSLVFTATTWNTRQTVTVTGVDDTDIDADIAYQVLVQAGSSADPNYNTFPDVSVGVTNQNDEIAGFGITAPPTLVTTEWGDTVEFTVVLKTPPTDRVTTTVTSSNLNEGQVMPTSLTFLPSSWNIPQTVTVTGQDDAAEDGDITYIVDLSVPTTTDPNYAGAKGESLSIVNLNDDPNPPLLCSAYTQAACPLRPDAAATRCATTGCTDDMCCARCDSLSPTACTSGQLVSDAATKRCAAGGCTADDCCYFPPPPPGSQLCSTYTASCLLRANPDRIVCPQAGCSDKTCCEMCSSLNVTACTSGLLRTDAADTQCDARGCDSATCCRPDKCFGVVCKPISQCHEAGSCDGSGLCTTPFKPEGTTCDDGDASTVRDKCSAVGVCAGEGRCAGVVCTAKSACFTAGVCSPDTGLCTEPRQPNGSPCDDGSSQTTGDTCQDGACVGSVACDMQTCKASDPQCNTAGCDFGSGGMASSRCLEFPKPDSTPCDDGRPETNGDQCNAGSCIGTSRCQDKVCTPKSQCHSSGLCDEATGVCSTPVLPDGGKCDDGNQLTTDDQCVQGTCLGTQKCFGVICRAPTQCHRAGTCDPTSGLCLDTPLPAGTTCDDGDSSTTDDKCDGLGGCAGKMSCGQCVASDTQCKSARCAQNDQCTEITRPDGTACSDGSPETVNDVCTSGSCVGVLRCQGVECPADQCHRQGVCEPSTGRCSTPVQPDNTPCNDGKAETRNDVCISGVCMGTPVCAGVVCPSATCRGAGTCDTTTGLCSEPILQDGTPCDDADPGTASDTCQSGSCVGTTTCGMAQCTATEPQCRRAYCAANRCAEVSRADGTACNDNNRLTTNDKCSSGVCVGENKCRNVVCSVTDPCRDIGQCDPMTGKCEQVGSAKPDGTPCDDGKAATVNDKCQGGTCSGTPACQLSSCLAKDQCHQDGVCDPTTGFCSTPLTADGTPCNDGDPTTANDRCTSGACLGDVACAGTACPSSDPQCMRSVCNANQCSELPRSDGTTCNDNNATTLDDKCLNGKCIGVDRCLGVVCAASSPCHDVGVCHPLTGVCSTPVKMDGSLCDDATAGTVNDKCLNGVCVGTDLCASVVCPATLCRGPGICEQSTGECKSQPLSDGTPCDDGDSSTTGDVCQREVCVGQLQCGSQQCTVSDPQCYTSVCENNVCTERAKADDTPCNDGSDKTTGDKCRSGVCVGVDQCDGVSCPSIGQCYAAGTCNQQTGRCSTPELPEGSPCNDGIASTRDDKCVRGQCVGTERCSGVICTASDRCHDAGVCDPATGLCSDPARPNGMGCDDGDPQTSNDKCDSGVCTGTLVCAGVTCRVLSPQCNVPVCSGMVCAETPKPDGTFCNDNNAATFNDKCRSGICIGDDKCTNVMCNTQPSNSCMLPGACEPATGVCSSQPRLDGSPCDDLDPKTSDDKCATGVCKGVNKCANVVCTASDACHVPGQCEFAVGVCTDPVAPDGTVCDDANVFSTNDRCVGGVCVGTTQCTAGSSPCPVTDAQCSSAACDNSQCMQISKPDGTVCNDGITSTLNDVCKSGKCSGTDVCDNVSCPAGMCNEPGVCDSATGRCTSSPKPDKTSCDDNNPLTINDQCAGGVCRGKERCEGIVCNKQGPCIGAGTCSMGACTYAKLLDGVACDDNNPQTTDDKCAAGVCVGSVPCVGLQCTAKDAQCGIPACNGNACVELAMQDGTTCDDGDSLTYDDMCTKGLCKGTRKCDNVVCRPISSCHYEGTCEPTTGLCSTPVKPNGTACDDANPLSLTSECHNGICVSTDKCLGQPVCQPLSQCHDAGICDPGTGVCSTPMKLDGEQCDDNDATTEGDRCQSGTCTGTPRCTPGKCVASDTCHIAGQCDPLTGMCSDPKKADESTCDDLNSETQGDRCLSGACVGQISCGQSLCVTEKCKKAVCTNGRCEKVPLSDGTPCNDDDQLTRDDVCRLGQCKGISLCQGVVCNAGQCSNAGQCNPSTGKCVTTSKPDGTECDDADTNTYNDICKSGACRGSIKCSGVVCRAKNQCYNVGVCDINTGLCSEPLKVGFSPCDDNRADTTNDQCQAGVCVGVLACGPLVCTNNNPQCTKMTCENDRCVESPLPDGTPCDDSNSKTLDDKCSQGLCSGVDKCAGVICTATSQCHTDGLCEPLTGRCNVPIKPAGTACDDMNPATSGDMCTGDGSCMGVDKCLGVVCSPSDQCHAAGLCDSLTGLCSDPVLPSDTLCSDGDPSTTDDRCSAGACSGSIVCGGTVCRPQNPACSVAVCDGGKTCTERPKSDGIACNDNDQSTSTDTCNAGACVGTNPCSTVQCAAQGQCRSVGVCNPQTGICSNPMVPDGTACDDGEDATGNDVCAAGQCKGESKCKGVVCTGSDACHDSGVCDERTGLCSDPPKATGTACTDGNSLTLDDKCVNGVCTGVITCGTDTCISSNPACMIAKCDNSQCTESPQPDGIGCNDNDPSTFSDRCVSGKCQGISRCEGIVCTPSSLCHAAGVCDATTGKCTIRLNPAGTPCDDNNAQTIDDMCTAKGVCTGVERCKGVVCSSSDACHEVGTCNPSTGKCSDPVKPGGVGCDDGNPDTVDDKCLNGVCAGTVLCGMNRCSSPSPSCQLPSCTTDACTVVNKPDGVTCNDGNAGTRSDVCSAGACVGVHNCAFVVCTPTDDCHQEGRCDPLTGECTNPVQADGTPCDDKNSRTVGDECRSGVCVGREKCAGVVCRASDSCHEQGQCDAATGLCTSPTKSDNTLCNDLDVTTQDDRCISGVCVGTVKCGQLDCKTLNPCMKPTCKSGKCNEVARPDGTSCNDGYSNSTGDKCISGTCRGVDKCAGVVCPAPDQCHFQGECDVLTGTCSNPTKPDRTTCDDGISTTKDDVCVSGRCRGVSKCAGVVCSASACYTSSACDMETGKCPQIPKEGDIACDDNDPLTFDDKCFAGTCRGYRKQYCDSHAAQCAGIGLNSVASPDRVECPLWTGCSDEVCCERKTCRSFPITGCSLRPSADSILCPTTGCDTSTCCGECARDGDAAQCATRELMPNRVCPSDGCKPETCCVPGAPVSYRVAVDVTGQPTDIAGATAALASGLGIHPSSFSDVRYTRGANGTSRLTANLTRSARSIDGSVRDSREMASSLQRRGLEDMGSTNNTWKSLALGARDMVVYPEGVSFPKKCPTGPATTSVVCSGTGQYGCPLRVLCEQGRTPCCADPDGMCDDGDDAVACIDYPKCPSSTPVSSRMCGGSDFYGCTQGVTCTDPTRTACCCDTDGSCTDGDDAVCCAEESVDECANTCPTCANTGSGNACTMSTVRGSQRCEDPSPQTAGDWRCVCTRLTDRSVAGGDAICPPAKAPTDVIVRSSNRDEQDLSDKIAQMLGTDKQNVIATTDGAGTGQMRVVIPDEVLRGNFLQMTRICSANALCQNTGINSIDAQTECPALSYAASCQEKAGCEYRNGACAAAALQSTPTPPAPDSDDGFGEWWYWLIIAIVLLCLSIAAAYMFLQNKKKHIGDISYDNPVTGEPKTTDGYWTDESGPRRSPSPAPAAAPVFYPEAPEAEDHLHPLVPASPETKVFSRPPPLPPTFGAGRGTFDTLVSAASPSGAPLPTFDAPDPLMDPLGPHLGPPAGTASYTYIPRSNVSSGSYNRLPV